MNAEDILPEQDVCSSSTHPSTMKKKREIRELQTQRSTLREQGIALPVPLPPN